MCEYLDANDLKSFRLLSKRLSPNANRALFKSVRLRPTKVSLEALCEKAVSLDYPWNELVIDRNWLFNAPPSASNTVRQAFYGWFPASMVDQPNNLTAMPWLTEQFDFINDVKSLDLARSLVKSWGKLKHLRITNTVQKGD
ncbi:MAG: hypothetical protein M1834_004695 [Cirrosporium novae-zelandiae]|nr:MAG: hypothetical protein M1834_004695 [Cirrosporium novae-zelandiae]